MLRWWTISKTEKELMATHKIKIKNWNFQKKEMKKRDPKRKKTALSNNEEFWKR